MTQRTRRMRLSELPDAQLSGRTVITGNGARITIATDCTAHESGEHNCIPIKQWFRRRWICVRCHKTYPSEVR